MRDLFNYVLEFLSGYVQHFDVLFLPVTSVLFSMNLILYKLHFYIKTKLFIFPVLAAIATYELLMPSPAFNISTLCN